MQRQHESAYPLAEGLASSASDTGKYSCPECTPDRNNQRRLDLQITVESDRTLYKCHHCPAEGMVITKKDFVRYEAPKPASTKDNVTHIPTPLNNPNKIIDSFFTSRGVDASDIDFHGHIITGTKYFSQLNANLDAVGFIYGSPDDVQAIKWRPADTNRKAFTQDNAARSFYGLCPMKKDQDEIIIVEGESDVVALESIGITAWSVPNGAPMKVSKGRLDPQEDKKFSYVWDAWDELNSAEKIIFATDEDVAGNALKQELARRIGLEKCWEVKFSEEDNDPTGMLNSQGSDAVKNLFADVKRMPLKGVYDVDSYYSEVEELYRDGMASGESTGLAGVDEIFNVKEGMVYIVTGQPGGGKSEFIDELMVNLSKSISWKWAIASFENPPAHHIPKLMEKFTEKPFFKGQSQRISHNEMQAAKEFLDDHFVFLEQKDGSMPTIEDIIARIKLAIARCGVRGAVIDPYNYIDMSHYESEHSGISIMLSELSSFARANGVAIFFVAHPQKVYPREDGSMPVPKGSHISGSAAWWAKADIGITVHRTDHHVEIHCWKARFKWLGQVGMRKLDYNVVNGKYADHGKTIAKQWADFDTEIEVKQPTKTDWGSLDF